MGLIFVRVCPVTVEPETYRGSPTLKASVATPLKVPASINSPVALLVIEASSTRATQQVQKVGEVLRSHATLGVIEVFGAGRTNDTPNTISIEGSISGSTIIGVNATSGDEPGHTHSLYAASGSATTTLGAHVSDSSDPHGSVLTQTGIVASGTISGSTVLVTTDHTTSGSALVVGIITDTNATPPTASGYAQGTIYIQYTA